MVRLLRFVLAAVASCRLPIVLGIPISSDDIVPRVNGELTPLPYVRYTALGDSYTAGNMRLYGIRGDPDEACHRTRGSYAWQFTQRHLNTLKEFSFPACSGADTEGIEKEINSTEPGIGPIANYGFGHPDLVSITAGGNNGDTFSNIIKACVYPGWELFYNCEKTLKDANKRVESMQPVLETLYGHAKTHNLEPNGIRDVFVLGYARFYQILGYDCPKEGGKDFPVPTMGIDGWAAKINAVVLKMNDVVKAAAEASGVTYVDVDSAFEWHRICDAPIEEEEFQQDEFYYMNGGRGEDGYAPFHPTRRGHYEMSLAFEKAVYRLIRNQRGG